MIDTEDPEKKSVGASEDWGDCIYFI